MSPFPTADRLHLAVQHHEAGRFSQAEALYCEIIGEDPDHADAIHLLGVLCGQTHREAEAVQLIERAIAFRPAVSAQHSNLGNVLRQLGRLPDAIAAYRMAVRLNPSHARAWNNLGNALGDDRQLDSAIEAYQESLRLARDAAEVHSNLGIALRAKGRLDESIAAHERAVALAPKSSEAFNNLGVALADLGRKTEALAAHERAVQLNPTSLSAISNLAAALRRVSRIDDAISVANHALQIDPNYADAHNNVASALVDRGEFAAAARSCRRALEIRPHFADAQGNLAIALAYQGRLDEAMVHARLAVQNMPDQPLAHWNLSMLLLLVGDFELGWREHEWRWRCPSMLKMRKFKQPRWDGELLDGRTILLFAEQGFGDTLQFIRYAALVAQCGGRVVVECQAELVRLFDGLPAITRVIPIGTPFQEFDLQCPLMSVPFAMRKQSLTPSVAPYLCAPELHPDPSRWRINHETINVGLVWAGDSVHQNDRARSLPLFRLSPLARLSGITFHSLQKGPASEQINQADGMPLIDHREELTDFAATASLIQHLDVIVTVDTAVAHLAGVMGKPTYIMLAFMPDWRWMLHRDDSAWYPTVRLFRQRLIGGWDEVVAAVVESLESFSR